MNKWEKIRADYPVTSKCVYLFTNGGGPVSTPFVQHAHHLLTELSEKGREVMPAWDNTSNEIRSLVARMIHAQPQEIAFVINTAHAMTMLYGMFPKDYEIITMRDEFPTSFVGWLHNGFTVRFVDSNDTGHISLEDIAAQITPATRILITSHVMFRTGFRQDLKAIGELCRQHNIIHIVDATQSFGVNPIDVQEYNIDILIFHGYKWVTAGYGAGAMYVSQKILEQYPPALMGWYNVEYEIPDFQSVKDYTHFTPRKNAGVFESGTPPYINIQLLGHALQYLERIGIADIDDYIQSLISYLAQQAAAHGVPLLTAYPEAHHSAIQRLDITPEQYARAAQQNIVARYKNNQLTVALNFYNNQEDIDRLLAAIA
ncbi:aminotransferase class V-fold PLP-dependent enzyme [Chitinophaga eiseniae]|uniref:Aminotransferase class V-fold PLP-dependent enzyme n=1 Tax=Chitinophaga eiseniae TaxID=634771 RepID=A0A847STJ5_9BACT|nr:aminotransferase class V-fold PLP-dependent enzyme [Chitinophaga eiseniae]NLR80849.1 aminotransferase class V-fold PLP-dependent enzyme [Chitinophaga eiseniae]